MRILTYLLDHLDKHGRLGRDLWCYADDHRSKVMRLTAKEFIRRFLLHVLPKRFVRIGQRRARVPGAC
jgi:hypothetical protein